MLFNQHSNLEGMHAFLSASKYSWVNYDDQKLEAFYTSQQAAFRGTQLHDLADRLVRLGVKLPRNNKTLNAYVNDALGFRMSTEVVLMYSDIVFGTTDAISFRNNKLRIHDLKTGITASKMTQLKIYAAIFCLEYGVKPHDISIELRIYQNDNIRIEPDAPVEDPFYESQHMALRDEIVHIMSRIVEFDKKIQQWKREAIA